LRDGDERDRKADAGEAIHQNPVVAAFLLCTRRQKQNAEISR
jgi:hypothetical protein